MHGFLGDIKNSYLATGVGSLPFVDPQAALDFVFDTFCDQIPFWPQLPKRSFYENMYVQFSERLPGVRVDESAKSIYIDTKGKNYLSELEDCFNKTQAVDLDYFAISSSYAEGLYAASKRLMVLSWQGWVKAQVIGPISLGLTLLDESKNPILHNPELSDLIPLFLSLKAAWIAKQLKAHAKTRIIIFIDEPYLVAVGTSQCALPRAKVIEKINQVVGLIHESGAVAGLHCCGNTDWELVMDTDIDILNFDAYGYFDKLLIYEKALNSFLKRGGIPAIGIVPSSNDLQEPGLVDRLYKILKNHSRIFKNGILITSSCGCSGLSEDLARKAGQLCVELVQRLRVET